MQERDNLQEKQSSVSIGHAIYLVIVLVFSILMGFDMGFVHGFLAVWGLAVFAYLFFMWLWNEL